MRTILSLIGLAASAVLPAFAGDGRIPIYSAPTVITQSGHYVVTRAIVGPGLVIQVRAPDVEIDLNGQTLTSTGTTTPVIELAPGAPARRIAIRNGRIRGGSIGIGKTGLPSIDGVYIEEVSIADTSGDGIFVAETEVIELRRVQVEQAGGDGYCIMGDLPTVHLTMVDCSARGTSQDGIMVDGTSSSFFDVTYIRNVIVNAGWNGVHIKGTDGGRATENQVAGFGSTIANAAGWLAEPRPDPKLGWLFELNDIGGGGADDDGVRTTGNLRALIRNNTISRNGRYGLVSESTGSVLSDNIVQGNGSHGILVGVGLDILVDGNQIQGNGGFGLFFANSGGHAYRNNMYRGNIQGSAGGPGIAAATNAGGNLQ